MPRKTSKILELKKARKKKPVAKRPPAKPQGVA